MRKQIVHHDIKPATIMIMLQDVAGEPYRVCLVDCGLARFVEDGGSTQLLAGTPQCVALEQHDGKDIGSRSDVYAVGVMACQMRTGRSPFAGRSHEEILLEKHQPGRDPLVNMRPEVLRGRVWAVLCTARFFEQAARQRNAGAFRAALDIAWTLDAGGGGVHAPAALLQSHP